MNVHVEIRTADETLTIDRRRGPVSGLEGDVQPGLFDAIEELEDISRRLRGMASIDYRPPNTTPCPDCGEFIDVLHFLQHRRDHSQTSTIDPRET